MSDAAVTGVLPLGYQIYSSRGVGSTCYKSLRRELRPISVVCEGVSFYLV